MPRDANKKNNKKKNRKRTQGKEIFKVSRAMDEK